MLHFLSAKQISTRTGEPYGTVKSLISRRLTGADNGFPEPDIAVGEAVEGGGRGLTYGWAPDVIDRWHAEYATTKGHSRARKVESD
ncbi:hypothetical protein [Gordonia sp. NB41Y]|uniref:hypothetical protein n=1 Tax=Gordonia sp. NB41Y TaxID=875808 RepID=UPI0002BD6DD8|nr:hypothetical protein [Gordonia sp. NB41Y]EMP14520.1 hypothetical protein ISGA_2087 [Gordonia sp. NB41Y]WLP90278.1 hypothetical protein Q9K23_22635 [Gordonia sp. NB41Y]